MNAGIDLARRELVAIVAADSLLDRDALARVVEIFAAEEISFGRYDRRGLILIGGWGLLESLWYQPLTTFWRFWASFRWLVGRRPGWGAIPRGAALAEAPAEIALEAEPAPLPR